MVECPDAFQALAPLRVESFDVVVVDLFMPGAGGLELLDRLHRAGLEVPAPVVTAAGAGHLSRRSLELGASAVLAKPFPP